MEWNSRGFSWEPNDVKTVVRHHNDDILAFAKIGAVVERLRRCAVLKAAAI